MSNTNSDTSSPAVLYRETPADMPIPNRLNLLLVALVFGGAIALLWVGSYVESWWATLLVGIVFSNLLLTNYALFHEASHASLHSHPAVNRLFGTLTGLLFPMPFSMFRVTHQGHHLRNRTDDEMFDLYYPTDYRFIRYMQWYGVLCGLFWPWVPIGALLFAVCPGALRTRIFEQARSSNQLLRDIRDQEVRAIRVEVALTVVFFALLFWLLQLRWNAMLIMYACFSFNWSTRQYVGHAFSRRDVVEGAWNLRHYRWMSWLLLHGEWDLNHHRNPQVSWYYLPRLSIANEDRIGYIRQYWRMWLGPRLTTDPAPESLQQLPMSIHS